MNVEYGRFKNKKMLRWFEIEELEKRHKECLFIKRILDIVLSPLITITRIKFFIVSKMSKTSPEESAGFFSKIVYWWMNPLFITGYRRPLDQKDIWNLPSRFQSEKLANDFEEHWKKELKRSEQLKKDPSLLRAIWNMIFWSYSYVGLLKTVVDLCSVSAPYIMGLIIDYVNKDSPKSTMMEGYMYLCILFALNITSTIMINAYFYRTTTVGLSVRSALSMGIYKKSLRLSAAARQEYTSGKIMSMVSTDCHRIESFLTMGHALWAAPIQILLLSGMLIYQLG
jgi:ATP-binding cassette subfamily C (CFTR/MRP) protein 1